jgi:hypothetical protein
MNIDMILGVLTASLYIYIVLKIIECYTGIQSIFVVGPTLKVNLETFNVFNLNKMWLSCTSSLPHYILMNGLPPKPYVLKL